MTTATDSAPILVAGATGYIGGRLVPRLIDRGYTVRCLVRDPARLEGRAWADRVEIIQGDALELASLRPAMQGIGTAYYLIHSMGSGSDFHDRDLRAARHFADAASHAGVRRIIYLGGLAETDPGLSEHLRSRLETGQALAEAGVPVTEFRAGVIVGSGGLSFEMIRYLTERVPAMVCPRWVYTRTQPIGVRDVLAYLAAALETPKSAGRVIEIGGADTMTYGDMMLGYAEVRGLRRIMVPVPVLTPRLSSYWVDLVTPIPSSIARPLIEGLKNESIVRDPSARSLFPQIEPADYRTSVKRALRRLETGGVETAWFDALITSQGDERPVELTTMEGMVFEKRQRVIGARPAAVFSTVTGLGGDRGWLVWNWAWKARGLVDRLLGGVGFRRGRRHPDEVRVGDAIDFWRVEAVETDRMLRLRAEMKVPGRAWLQFNIEPNGAGCHLTQTAIFAPKGAFGWLYWYGVYPAHRVIFNGMIDQLAKRAEAVQVSRDN